MFAATIDPGRSGLRAIDWAPEQAAGEPAPAVRIALLEQARAAAPGEARLALALGEALIGQLELERAAAVLEDAVALDAGSRRPRLRLAQTLAMLRRFGRTLALLDSDGADQGAASDLGEWRCLRGVALEGLGDPAAAEAAYRRALEVYPAHSPAFRKLSLLLESAGRRSDLAALCRALLDAGVRHPRLLAQWGAELARAADGAGAAALLLDPDQVARAQLPTPAGFPTLAAFNAALAAEILANPYRSKGYAEDPIYRGGPRVHHLQHGARPDLITALLRSLQDQVDAWLASLRPGPKPSHDLWRQAAPQRAGLAAWGVVQSGAHHLTWHLHPNAWLSGVYYVDVPAVVSAAGDGPGCIEFGPPPEVAEMLRTQVPVLRIAPRSGMLLLAPGHYHHRSIPTGAADLRISIAFDVVPQAAPGALAWPPPRTA